jgi:hypothetical protein
MSRDGNPHLLQPGRPSRTRQKTAFDAHPAPEWQSVSARRKRGIGGAAQARHMIHNRCAERRCISEGWRMRRSAPLYLAANPLSVTVAGFSQRRGPQRGTDRCRRVRRQDRSQGTQLAARSVPIRKSETWNRAKLEWNGLDAHTRRKPCWLPSCSEWNGGNASLAKDLTSLLLRQIATLLQQSHGCQFNQRCC